MKHIRIPVSMGHPEAAWFGYVYMWQAQTNGTVGARVQMNDPRVFPPKDMDWDEPVTVDALGPSHLPMTLEEDARAILSDHFPHLRVVGSFEAKAGRGWKLA